MTLNKIERDELKDKVLASREDPINWSLDEQDLFGEQKDLDHLQQTLIERRQACLDRKSYLISINAKPIRIYPPSSANIKNDSVDIYARVIYAVFASSSLGISLILLFVLL